MKTLKRNGTKLAGILGVVGVAVFTVYACISAWGQTLPRLSIAMTNTNTAVSLVVTNGTTNGKYQIYWREIFEDDSNWQLVTNGGTGITNFTIFIGDDTQGFFKAVNNTNIVPFVLNLTVVAPASGANIQ